MWKDKNPVPGSQGHLFAHVFAIFSEPRYRVHRATVSPLFSPFSRKPRYRVRRATFSLLFSPFSRKPRYRVRRATFSPMFSPFSRSPGTGFAGPAGSSISLQTCRILYHVFSDSKFTLPRIGQSIE